MTLPEALALGLQHHQSGRLAEAEAIYRQILAVEPNHADALHSMGVLAQQAGRRDLALDLVRRAIALNGAVPVYHSNLAVICRSLGLLDDAMRCYQRILELDPGAEEARRNLQVVTDYRRWNEPRADGRPAQEPAALEAWLAQANDIGMLQVAEEIRGFCAFLREQDLNHVMEIGSHKGGTFFLLCRLARGKKISLDLPGGAFGGLDQKDAELRNRAMQTWAPQVYSLLADSSTEATRAQVSQMLGGDPLDLLFIDGNHTYEGVKADYEQYRHFVRPGGFIAFHDIVDSENHRAAGCFVAKLWHELQGEKIEFNAQQQWAGIGVLRTPTTDGRGAAASRSAVQEALTAAIAHHENGRLAEADAIYRRILGGDPRQADALHLSGVLAGQMGRDEVAVEMILQAIALSPTVPAFHSNLGEVYRKQARLGEAIAEYRRALEFDPDYAEAHNNLGAALASQDRLEEAILAYRRALQLKPDYAAAHNNLGNVLRDQGHFNDAIAAYGVAIRLKPDFAGFHNNLGAALKDQGKLNEAIAAYRRALELKPDSPVAHSSLLVSLHHVPNLDPEEVFREHRHWEEVQARPLARFIVPPAHDRNSERRLRIGYVSPDFRAHSVAFFMEGLLAAHDRSQVEVFCYADLLREDRMTERLRPHAAHWSRITGLSDGQVADLIRKDRIDILVDLAGHTAGNRLLTFARKPAPVQVTWLGYPNTTGMKTMDYRLTDARADPPGATEHLHSEKLSRLPDGAWCFRPSEDVPEVGPPPFASGSLITFGCFNARAKISDEMLILWAGLLRNVPGSRLLLKEPGFDGPSARERMQWLLFEAGVDRERVGFVGRVPSRREHLGFYDRVDIALDTFPYHGTTTTCEALWMGVPVVTLAGKTHVSRVGVSLLSNAGLPEMIAGSAEQYVEIAVRLAGDPARLAHLRSTLRERMRGSVLMDAPRFAGNIEDAYRQMWRAWCAE